jgi:hypothetical protein
MGSISLCPRRFQASRRSISSDQAASTSCSEVRVLSIEPFLGIDANTVTFKCITIARKVGSEKAQLTASVGQEPALMFRLPPPLRVVLVPRLECIESRGCAACGFDVGIHVTICSIRLRVTQDANNFRQPKMRAARFSASQSIGITLPT